VQENAMAPQCPSTTANLSAILMACSPLRASFRPPSPIPFLSYLRGG